MKARKPKPRPPSLSAFQSLTDDKREFKASLSPLSLLLTTTGLDSITDILAEASEERFGFKTA